MLLILIRTAILYLLLSVLLRGMGKRQIGQLEVGEMITTFLLSEVIALPIADKDLSLLAGIVPALFIFCSEILLSSLKNRSASIKRMVEGTPVYLIYKGTLMQSALRENRISLNELLCSLRGMGVFAPETVEYAILETNGTVSVMQKASAAPLSAKGLRGEEDEGMSHPLILDGEIQKKALSLVGKSEAWLLSHLAKKKIPLSAVFLLTVNDKEEIHIIKKENA